MALPQLRPITRRVWLFRSSQQFVQSMSRHRKLSWSLLSLLTLTLLGVAFIFASGTVLAAPNVVLQVSPTSVLANNCTYNHSSGWSCTVTLSRGDSTNIGLKWSATAGPGIVMQPASGVLPAGGTTTVSFTVTNRLCPSQSSLTFKGPANTVRVPWSCGGPTMTLDTNNFAAGQNCPTTSGGWTCTALVGESASSQGDMKWHATTAQKLTGVVFSPPDGLLTPGSITTVSIFVPSSDCFASKFFFVTPNNTTITALWNCKGSVAPPPTFTVSPTTLSPSSGCTASSDGTYQCTLTLTNTSALATVNYHFTSTINGIQLPADGSLTAGQQANLVVSQLPCTGGTHSINIGGREGEKMLKVLWTCTPPPPTFTVNTTSLTPTPGQGCVADRSFVNYTCQLTITNTSASATVNYHLTTSLSNVSLPADGSLLASQQVTVSILSIPCANGSIVVNGLEGEAAIPVQWSCALPTFDVHPTQLDPTQCQFMLSSTTYGCSISVRNTSSLASANYYFQTDMPNASLPASGTLLPGQQTTLQFVLNCQTGTITLLGMEAEPPITITWTCTSSATTRGAMDVNYAGPGPLVVQATKQEHLALNHC